MSGWKGSGLVKGPLFMACAVLAFGCSRGSQPATNAPASPAPVLASQPVAPPAQPEPSPTAQPDASTLERWAALGAAVETPQAPATGSTFPTMAPMPNSEPPPTPTPEGPSETQALQEKIERYRAEYGAAKSKVESIEREVARLEELAKGVYAGGNSASATLRADVVRADLNRARGELDEARRELTAVEERARRDGVGYGQLY